MAFTIEKIIIDAHNLALRLKEHDITADSLISRTQSLHRQVEAMKQYQDNLNELNEIARHRPRTSLILSLAQENSQIRELQQENKELRDSLEEHQTALELIMSKYREQISKLLKAEQLERTYTEKKSDHTQEMQEKLEKIYEMAAVMWKAIKIDDQYVDQDQQIIAQLMKENASMRELLQISSSHVRTAAQMVDTNTETEEEFFQQTDDMDESDIGSPDGFKSLSSSVIVVKSLDDSGLSTSSCDTSTVVLNSKRVVSGAQGTAEEEAELAAALQQLDDIVDQSEGQGDETFPDSTSLGSSSEL